DLQPDGLESILLHPLPENLRGLARIIHRGAALGKLPYHAEPVDPRTAPEEPPAARATADKPPRAAPRPRPSKEELLEVLRANEGRVKAVARHYDRHHRQIYRWIDHYDLRHETGGRGDPS
ncbi:MAG: hypothetical protein AAGA56_29075, partial [Myxococcota bacterium]